MAAQYATPQTAGRPYCSLGGQDHTIPEAITKFALKQYRHSHAVNDLIEFPGRRHSLTVDHGWHDVASACPDWLLQHSL